MSILKYLFFFLLIVLDTLIEISSCYSQENIKYANTININDLYDHISVLASDSLEGRETGKPGQKKAAKYIASHFQKIGIPPYKRKTYFQKFKVKSKRHVCKCDDCDLTFFKRVFKSNQIIKGENVLGYIEGTRSSL